MKKKTVEKLQGRSKKVHRLLDIDKLFPFLMSKFFYSCPAPFSKLLILSIGLNCDNTVSRSQIPAVWG